MIAFNTLLLESELNTTQREFVRASLTSADALLGKLREKRAPPPLSLPRLSLRTGARPT